MREPDPSGTMAVESGVGIVEGGAPKSGGEAALPAAADLPSPRRRRVAPRPEAPVEIVANAERTAPRATPADAIADDDATADASAPGRARGTGAIDAAAREDLLAREAARVMPLVEAVLIASPRAVSASRLAVAVGLATADEGEAAAAAAARSSEDPEPTANATDSPAPRRRRRVAVGGPVEGSSATPAPVAIVRAAIARLNDELAGTHRAFRVEPVAGGYRIMTLPEHAAAVGALHQQAQQGRLSRASVETLAIIAYRQPVTRSALEAIRGVACGETLKTLLDRRLISIAGRAEELGRPILYATTRQFLDAFGLASLKDLPAPEELGLRAGMV